MNVYKQRNDYTPSSIIGNQTKNIETFSEYIHTNNVILGTSAVSIRTEKIFPESC